MSTHRTHNKNVRRVNHPAMRDAGRSPGRTHAERTAHAGVGPHSDGRPDVAGGRPSTSAAEFPRSAGTHGGRVPSSRPSAVPPRPLWGWLIVSFVLLLIGAVSCHNEADGSPFCAEASCEVTP